MLRVLVLHVASQLPERSLTTRAGTGRRSFVLPGQVALQCSITVIQGFRSRSSSIPFFFPILELTLGPFCFLLLFLEV